MFKLIYTHDSKSTILAKREYPYNSKFFGYMDLAGFSDLLAFDILVHSPMQWHKSVIKQNEFINPLTLSSEKKFSIEISNATHDLELNRNLFFVRTKIESDGMYVAESNPQSISIKSKITLQVGEILPKFIVFGELSKIPDQPDVYLSLGHDPVTRYYTSKKVLYLIRKLEKMNLTFFFATGTFGISQILSTNDELSYLGIRYAQGLSQEKKILS